MIKIFYDHQKFSTQLYGGISRYFANLIQAIEELPDFDYLLGVLYSNNHYVKSKISNELIRKILKNPNYVYKLNQLYCRELLRRNNFDIFHPTYYDTYFFDRLKKPLVITIHDMTYERLPEYFWAEDSLTKLKRLNIERADRIIAISETTKSDLLKYSEVDESKIQVIYHGMDLKSPFVTNPIDNLPEKYLLFVGDRSGYKNFYLFLNAFKRVSAQHPDIQVILTGGGSLKVAELEYLKLIKLDDKVSHKNVSDSELNFLYQNATCFIYPSLHEGFGLPILEAFRAGCPMILSDTECFKEIASYAAIYFDANSVDELTGKIERIITEPSLQNTLTADGAVRLKDFPLDNSLKRTLDVYKELL
ncbi:glycosyltransferase family 4 protein [Paradesertivirga mongoliensis]|uniref:Glycosyltransferase family 4 protein n=1 Tax=Paradesertivirga mongoliensis TaxID=2100740 RepID=A0ABW4ZLF6_9SPHI|nr:glycosyltransferase family 1 protein [Pedobacter mongoliensis]